MAKSKNDTKSIKHKASTPERRENLLISLSYDLAEARLREGTASAQEVVHFLKLGSTKEKLEKEYLEQKVELSKAKTEALKSAKEIEALYVKAMDAMKSYSGDN